jgi:hypothetical protein
MIGLAAATAFAVAAPAAANAGTTTAADTIGTATKTVYSNSWGSVSSTDHKAKARGKVAVKQTSYKKKYPTKQTKWVKKCWEKDGKKHCKPVKKTYIVWKYKWVKSNSFNVSSGLTNYKSWGSKRSNCAWETFRVVNSNGSLSHRSFRNCDKGTDYFSFSGKDAKRIYVQVARGSKYSANSKFSGWTKIYG